MDDIVAFFTTCFGDEPSDEEIEHTRLVAKDVIADKLTATQESYSSILLMDPFNKQLPQEAFEELCQKYSSFYEKSPLFLFAKSKSTFNNPLKDKSVVASIVLTLLKVKPDCPLCIMAIDRYHEQPWQMLVKCLYNTVHVGKTNSDRLELTPDVCCNIKLKNPGLWSDMCFGILPSHEGKIAIYIPEKFIEFYDALIRDDVTESRLRYNLSLHPSANRALPITSDQLTTQFAQWLVASSDYTYIKKKSE